MKVLLIDNNDSFTYNIVEMLRQIDDIESTVIASNQLNIDDVSIFDRIIFSPGPSLPCDYPIMFDVLKRFGGIKPILGICLGFQAICQYYGADLVNLPAVIHGVPSLIDCLDSSHLFRGIKNMTVGRYHSWIVDNIPAAELVITAKDEYGTVMAVEHRCKAVYGVQFHPESYITSNGKYIFERFIYG